MEILLRRRRRRTERRRLRQERERIRGRLRAAGGQRGRRRRGRDQLQVCDEGRVPRPRRRIARKRARRHRLRTLQSWLRPVHRRGRVRYHRRRARRGPARLRCRRRGQAGRRRESGGPDHPGRREDRSSTRGRVLAAPRGPRVRAARGLVQRDGARRAARQARPAPRDRRRFLPVAHAQRGRHGVPRRPGRAARLLAIRSSPPPPPGLTT
mmetsp:Transcript_11132/g.32967  ORF Transcript_11132/g.32967 Transcript_11132/m.32967 type:complete len:210 (+) Transcript_11132:750-1379(+)